MRFVVRWEILALTAVSAVAGAILGHWAWPREARAEAGATISTVYVPPDGVVFRTLDGHPVARLSRAAAGGVLELYDIEDQPTGRYGAAAPALVKPKLPDCACTTPQSVMLDDLDPWGDRR